MNAPARRPARRPAARPTTATATTAPLAMAMALLLATVTGCAGGTGAGTGNGSGSSSDDKAAVSSLTVLDYYTDAPEHQQWEEALASCGKAAGVGIEHTSVPPASLVPRVLRQASSRTLPDLLMLDNPDLQQIAGAGALAPLDEFGVDTQGVTEGILSAGTYDGKVYGLAPYVSTVALFYNKDMLAEAGVAVPRTWDELRTAAARLTRPGRYGMAVDANATFEGTWQFLPFLWSNGGDETKLDTSEAAGALRLWTDLVTSGSMSKSVLTWDQGDVHDQFAAGRTAMMINGPWRIPALDKLDQLDKDDKNGKSGKNGKLKWGVAPVPVPRAGQRPVTPLGGEVWTVPRSDSPARQRKAAEVLGCLNDSSHSLALATQHHTVPSRTAVAARYAERNPSMGVFVDSVGDARVRTARLGVRWPKAATGIYTAIQSALAGRQTPEEALRDAQRIATDDDGA
ncbi:extracellular solute-binding protein [Streptomyces sp. NPDC048718]|uniref:extracellular solute-binding protein n=1 Tax=Streptomyces sp. NPDC048718 TaxID=3365587 RepID=UPI0037209D0F